MKRLYSLLTRGLPLGLVIVLPAAVAAHDWDDCSGWQEDHEWGDKGRYCEVRNLTVAATNTLTVDAGRNGGISVHGDQMDGIEIEARVQVWEKSAGEARDLAERIAIHTDSGRISAHGPAESGWSVSYRIRVPRNIDLDLSAHNGGISIDGVEGQLRAETRNGGLSLSALAGDVQASTTNGGLRVQLTGDRWRGSGLDAETRNGGVDLSIPAGYSAELETGTVNGRIDIGFPVTVQGRIGQAIETTLGDGGPPVRVKTRNGGVTISEY